MYRESKNINQSLGHSKTSSSLGSGAFALYGTLKILVVSALSVCNIFFKTSFSTTLSRLGLKSTITDGANGITILRSA